MEPAQQLDFTQHRLDQRQKHLSPTDVLRLFSSDGHTYSEYPVASRASFIIQYRFRNRPYDGISSASHVSVGFKLLVSDNFIPFSDWSKRSKGENQQQTEFTYVVVPGIRHRAIMMGDIVNTDLSL